MEKVTRGALVRRDVTRWLSAMVSLIEHSDRSVRRYQRRFEDGGLAALGQSALNCRWRRPTLQWRTAHEMWAARPPIEDDRDELHDEVEHRTARLRVHEVADLERTHAT